MTEIIYINVISAIRMCLAISLVIGFLISVMITIPGALCGINTFFTDYSLISGTDAYLSVIFDIIFITLLFAISGMACGVVFSMTYNFISLIFGGLEIELLENEIYVEENVEENPIGYE